MALLMSTPAFPQSRIEGEVKGSNGQPVPYANILLLHADDSTLAKGGVADTHGQFSIEDVPPGNFFVVTTMVGYKKTTMPSFTISNERTLTLLPMILHEETVELNEVTVEAEKPMFEQKLDRLVVNVENSITTAGNSVLEVLQKAPGVIVDRQNSNINMHGKSGVRIMINGKMSQLPMDAVVQMLDGMSAANIRQIELISTPPAKYDAEGNAGIIHIVLKENADYGTSGNVGLTLGYKWAEVYGGNFSVQHRSKRAAYFLDYSALRQRNRHVMDMYRESVNNGFVQEVTNVSNRKPTITVQSIRAGAEIPISRSSTVSVLLTASGNKWDMNALTHDVNRAAHDSTVITDMMIREVNNWQSATGGLKFQTKPSSKSDLSIDLDYIYYTNNNPSGYDNQVYYPGEAFHAEEKIDVTKHTPLALAVGKMDYVYRPAHGLTVETGVKGVMSTLDNDVVVRRWNNNTWEVDPFFTSRADLKEDIAAGYLSTTWEPGNGLYLSAGLRYEHTKTYISTPAVSGIVDRDYGNAFPSFFVKKDLGKEKDVSFSYSRRITRPTFRDIAPFVFFWSTNTFSSGNTSLWPSVSDGLRAGYHAGPWVLVLQYHHAENEISILQAEIDGAGNLIYRSQNLKYLNTLSVTNSITFNPAAWWEVQANVTAQQQTARTSHFENNASLTLYNVNVNVTNQLKLPHDFSIELSGFYQSKSIFGIAEFLPFGSLNAGIQKKFKNNGTLRLGMDDILYTNKWRWDAIVSQANLNSQVDYDWHNQFVRLAYSRNFGNRKLRSFQMQSGAEEERRRAN